MPLKSLPPKQPLPFHKALRHLLVFQIKLLADALRDLMFSPISLLAFIADSITRPAVEDSLSFKLMNVGRHSDRVINLFDEYSSSDGYTIDETVAEVESALQRELEKRKE